jgi:hypothetical protein
LGWLSFGMLSQEVFSYRARLSDNEGPRPKSRSLTFLGSPTQRTLPSSRHKEDSCGRVNSKPPVMLLFPHVICIITNKKETQIEDPLINKTKFLKCFKTNEMFGTLFKGELHSNYG